MVANTILDILILKYYFNSNEKEVGASRSLSRRTGADGP